EWAWSGFTRNAPLPGAFLDRYDSSTPRMWPWRDYVVGKFAGRWPDEWEDALLGLERDAAARTPHRSMCWEEIGAFAKLPGVEIGIHTVTHPVLPALPDGELADEILDCYTALRERLDEVLPVLAIPFGLGDMRTVRLARQAGMLYSMSVSRRTVNQASDRHPIPRFCISRQEQPWKLNLRVSGVTERLLGWRGEAFDYPAVPTF
ncbi:MAG: polysaccharide deacetylase family protein, partial [Gemmatimonadales bacterium]